MNYLNVPPMEILVIFRILTKSVTTTTAENAALTLPHRQELCLVHLHSIFILCTKYHKENIGYVQN
jgi:hypothetical protein